MVTVENGQQRLISDCFDLPSLMENIARSKAEQAAIKDVEIISFIDPSTPAVAKGDPDRLHQIMMSLVGYAVDCGDHGDVSIQVKAEEKTKSFSIVNFSISFYCSEALAGRLQAI